MFFEKTNLENEIIFGKHFDTKTPPWLRLKPMLQHKNEISTKVKFVIFQAPKKESL